MKSPRVLTSLALAGLVALQISCGGDSSGPGASASSIAANSSTTIGAAPGTQVAELPSVIVKDAAGNPVGGVPVTFAITSGGGSITGSKVSSGSDGIATVGSWTLGQTPGVNTLTATAGNLPAVTFTAQGADPCAAATPHTLGSTTSGALSLSDCRLSDGSFVDFYTISVPSSGTYTFTQTGNFRTYLALLTASSSVIAVGAGAPTTSVIKALLPAGSFLVGANSYDPNVTGTYTVSSASSTAQITNCEDAFVLVGTNSDQSLQTTDCVANGFYSDEYLIFLLAGQGITVSMSSASIDSYLEIHADGNSTVLASNDNIDGSTQNARVAFTAPGTGGGFYIIKARTPTANVTGPYNITVQ